MADLAGYGWVGLMEAYQRSAANMREEEFEAYALYRVRGAMLDYLSGALIRVTRDLRRSSRRVARAIRDLSQKLGREPEEEEIAESMGMQLRNYRELLEKIAAAGMARLELLDLDDIELEQNGETVDDAVAKRRLADAVVVAMETLPPKLVQVLALYYQEECVPPADRRRPRRRRVARLAAPQRGHPPSPRGGGEGVTCPTASTSP